MVLRALLHLLGLGAWGWGSALVSSWGDRTLVPCLLRSCVRVVMPMS
jgi:hypothetical protein